MEDRQAATEQDALIAEMLRSAKGVDLPSDLKTNPVIHKGDEDLPAPMTVSELRSGKYFYIWETATGERVPCLGYMMGQKLRQKLPNGKYRFTTVDPGIRPIRGTVKCMLHADNPNREHYDQLGFRVCRKSNITNSYQLEQHMKKRHPQEWEAIENERKTREREEDRAFQRLILSQSANLLPKTPAPTVIPEDRKSFVCSNCGADFGSQKTLDKHKNDQHK